MYAINDLDQEIMDKAQQLRRDNGGIPKSWLVQIILKDHGDLSGGDTEMALCCMQETVGERVGRYFRKVKASEDSADHQMVLPGFAKLQKEYLIMRNGEPTIVEVHKMTDAEIEEKADEHLAMSRGHQEHAVELRRYIVLRRQNITA